MKWVTGAARARFLAAFARSKAVPPEAGAFMTSATRMSSSRQKINLCKSRNPKPPIEFLMVWEFCFRLLQCKEFTPSTRIAVFTNLEGNPVQSKYLHRISL